MLEHLTSLARLRKPCEVSGEHAVGIVRELQAARLVEADIAATPDGETPHAVLLSITPKGWFTLNRPGPRALPLQEAIR